MSTAEKRRGAAPVGYVAELDDVEAAAVIYLRLWCESAGTQAQVRNDFSLTLGPDQGRQALKTFEQLCNLCIGHGRRPLMRHAIGCRCLGSDEACFANFIATAAEGAREDALMIATLLVRADMAPLIASLAAEFGLALKRLCLCAAPRRQQAATGGQTLH